MEVGDVVVAGQPIARYVDDAALERAEAEVERARRDLVAAEAELVAAEEVAVVERARWAVEVRSAVDEAERVGRLVEVGARPRVEAVEAGLRVGEARWREVEGLTRWTSERGGSSGR